MKKKDEVYVESSTGVLVVNGKKFVVGQFKSKMIDETRHMDKTIFKEFDEESHKKKVAFIKEKIENMTTKDELLEELLNKVPVTEIEKVYKSLKKDDKPKPIKKQSGCLGFQFGEGKDKTYIELVGGF